MIARFWSPSVPRNTCSFPFRDLSKLPPKAFMAEVERTLNDPTAYLAAPATDLLRHIPEPQIQMAQDVYFKERKPSGANHIAAVIGGALNRESFGDALARSIKFNSERNEYQTKINTTRRLMGTCVLTRAAATLPDGMAPLVTALAALVANGIYTEEQWKRDLATLIYSDHDCTVLNQVPDDPLMMDAHQILKAILTVKFPFQETRARIVTDTERARLETSAPAAPPASHGVPIKPIAKTGAHWMEPDELAQSQYYETVSNPSSVLIGYDSTTDLPIYFSGNESLITVAGPGAGKSQTQVIPNLLRYPGSAIVLDVKGELWEATAAWRKKTFGPVYRFAPTDPNGQTHRYNPFDFISQDPTHAANDATVFSYQVMVENPNQHDPYWENRGRDTLWAFALYLATKATGTMRGMAGLAELANIPQIKDKNAPIHGIIESMLRVSDRIKIPDLAAAANAIKTGIGSTRLESVMDTSRRVLSTFTRSPTVMNAISTSDWRPEQFRKRPGTTLYICLDSDEIKAYAPLVRLILAQHARVLMKNLAKPGEPPITYFLDEMPQLGNFEALQHLQAVGRGAGIRLWMFSQTIGQLANAFGKDRYMGVLESCRVRCFMQPELETAQMLIQALGMTDSIAGNAKPLATVNELIGRTYGDKIIVTTRGDYPMNLNKRFAWKTDANKLLPPPSL